MKGYPALALGITFLCALVLGSLIGAILIVLLFRFRNQALRKRSLGSGKPEYHERALHKPDHLFLIGAQQKLLSCLLRILFWVQYLSVLAPQAVHFTYMNSW